MSSQTLALREQLLHGIIALLVDANNFIFDQDTLRLQFYVAIRINRDVAVYVSVHGAHDEEYNLSHCCSIWLR